MIWGNKVYNAKSEADIACRDFVLAEAKQREAMTKEEIANDNERLVWINYWDHFS